MIKIKPIIISASAAFVFSFFTALFAKSGVPIALLKAVIFAIVFGGIAVGIQFVYGSFLSEGGSAAEQPEEAKTVGSKVDLVVSEEDLPDDKDGPAFFVDGKHVLSGDDTGAQRAEARQEAVSAAQQNEALEAAEAVRQQKAAQNIAAAGQQIAQESAAQNEAAVQSAPEPSASEVPSFAPIDLAAKSEAPKVSAPAAPAPSASSSSGDSELDELPDISGFGGGAPQTVAAAQDDGVIEDSEFAQDGSVKVHRQTELADGKVADVKDAPVMAEAIRTILKKEE